MTFYPLASHPSCIVIIALSELLHINYIYIPSCQGQMQLWNVDIYPPTDLPQIITGEMRMTKSNVDHQNTGIHLISR